jgi:hypothetical protein
MTVETTQRIDLTESLARAAVAAIADIAPQLEAAGPKLGLLTLELEIDTKGRVVGGVAWPQLRVNVGKLLGVGRG